MHLLARFFSWPGWRQSKRPQLDSTAHLARWRRLCRPWSLVALLGLLSFFLWLLLHPLAAPPVPAARGWRGPLVALTPASTSTPQVAHSASDCGVTDLTSCINDWITSFTHDQIAAWIQQQVNNFTAYGFIFQTPDSVTYNAQPVQEMEHFSLSVVGAFLTVILAVAGFNHIMGRSTAWSETLPQVIWCGVMAFAFQPFLSIFIQLSNDFIFGMQFAVGAQPTFPAYGAAGDAFMDVIAFIFELLGDLLLAIEALARLVLLDLLIALAPLGIMSYALPQTRAWGRMWAEAFTATLLIQPIQAALVMLGAKMLSLLGNVIDVVPPLVQILVGLASILLALWVPKMLLSGATHVIADFQRETAQVSRVLAAAAA